MNGVKGLFNCYIQVDSEKNPTNHNSPIKKVKLLLVLFCNQREANFLINVCCLHLFITLHHNSKNVLTGLKATEAIYKWIVLLIQPHWFKFWVKHLRTGLCIYFYSWVTAGKVFSFLTLFPSKIMKATVLLSLIKI